MIVKMMTKEVKVIGKMEKKVENEIRKEVGVKKQVMEDMTQEVEVNMKMIMKEVKVGEKMKKKIKVKMKKKPKKKKWWKRGPSAKGRDKASAVKMADDALKLLMMFGSPTPSQPASKFLLKVVHLQSATQRHRLPPLQKERARKPSIESELKLDNIYLFWNGYLN
ncbi:hypothetical protein Scep_005175 [Stephania cephalantha]|uniref:Uncharacterized protein n=1 Tax=Stephania cephalantha TaxID=152367 RepID=A0AAP0KTT9_9MAGN